MTPEMWLDLEPIHTVATRIAPQIANPSGIQRGVALQPSWLGTHVLHLNWCATFPFVVLVPRLGGWGTKIFQNF